MTATRPVEAPGVRRLATQPVEAPGAGPEVLPIGTGSVDVRPDQSLTSETTVSIIGVSDSDDELHSEPGSPAGGSVQGKLSDRDTPRDEALD